MSWRAIQRFDRAAASYDSAAEFQAQSAALLVARAAGNPASILDIGCGTGLVAQAASMRWPMADVTALDASPAMLRQAQIRLPKLRIVAGDAASTELPQRFDMIFSGMMLHWLPDPVAALRRWRGWLHPGGALHVSLLGDGSFMEWRELCAAHDMPAGLWPMPCADFAAALQPRVGAQDRRMLFPDALSFLRRLKRTGAATALAAYRPLPAPRLRRLLQAAPKPFPVTYRTIFVDLTAGPFA